MSDNNSPWGPKPGSGNNGGKGGGNSPWGNGGGERPNKPKRPNLNNVEKFRPRSGGGGGNGGGNSQLPDFNFGPFGPMAILAAGLIIFLVSSMFYTVDQTERALVLRFGEYERTSEPGLHVKLPSPIETLYRQETEIIRKDNIGGNDKKSLMLTGDENIVDIDFTVLWRINDLANYYFEIENPANAVNAVAESAMREIIGKNELQKIITTDRLAITTAVRDLIQETLDEYKTGVRIVEVQLQKADAPDQGGVVDAFRDVVDAAQERETSINQAVATQNTIVPEARGEASQILQDAEAYRDRVVAEAEGEAERFNKIYSEYKKAPRVTRQRLYLETIEDVFGPAEKIILDSEGGSGVVPYLPLDQLGKRKTTSTGGQ